MLRTTVVSSKINNLKLNVMENFQEIKNKIICSAKESNACKTEFNRALNSKDIQELLKVVKDNFNYCCNNKIITKDLLEEIGKEVCEENDLFLNVSTNKGYLFADSATVRAWGSATVEAWGSAYINSFNSLDHKISDKVILRYYFGNKVILAENISNYEKR